MTVSKVQGSTESPDLIAKRATTECPQLASSLRSRSRKKIKASSSSSKVVFQQGKIAVAGTAVAWNGISLDGTHANSFNTKYKMVREYIYVIHSTQGEGEKWFSLIYNINKIDGIVWYTMTFDLDNYKYIL